RRQSRHPRIHRAVHLASQRPGRGADRRRRGPGGCRRLHPDMAEPMAADARRRIHGALHGGSFGRRSRGPEAALSRGNRGKDMDPLTLALGSLGLMLVLLALRLPIGVAMGAVAFLGFWYVRNFDIALSVLRDAPFTFGASWELSAIPMFLLMGAVAGNSGIGTALFRAALAWLGWMPGGLAVATNWACAGFGAASGSSVAAAAVMARLAVPEMLKAKYDKALATGVCASGGTLDALIPPSITFVIYGIFAEVSISKLLIAGILPGILTA